MYTYKYRDVVICKADRKRLDKIDKEELKMREKLQRFLASEASGKNNINREFFISNTFPAAITQYEEQRLEILNKYSSPSPTDSVKHIRILTICICVILTLCIIFAAIFFHRYNNTFVYVDGLKNYHKDEYCIRLTSKKTEILLKEAKALRYTKCPLCAK